MREVLQEISKKIILSNDLDIPEEQAKSGWVGNKPATRKEITEAQRKLKITLPEDYIEFLKITNGFPPCSSTGVTFLPVGQIDYLINLDEDLVESWNRQEDLADIGKALAESLLIGGLHEEQYFLLIPPNVPGDRWRYWMFANWIPGEQEYESFTAYLHTQLECLLEEIKDQDTPSAKYVIDYSLRNFVFNGQWQQVFDMAYMHLSNGIKHIYIRWSTDLLGIFLLAADRLGKLKHAAALLKDLREHGVYTSGIDDLLRYYETAANAGQAFVDKFQHNPFLNHVSPVTIEEIEAQIKANKPRLLQPKNAQAKVNYQCNFLFAYGDAESYIKHYELHKDSPSFDVHLKAAITYATTGDVINSKAALEKYFGIAFTFDPLGPFVDKTLAPIIDEAFSKHILRRFG